MRRDSLLEARTRERLAALSAAGMRRALASPSGIDLASNDYLNLSQHPAVIERFADAIRRLGAGSTGSRLLRGHRDAFTAVERRFARFKGADASLYFSSGYLANLAVLTALPEPGDTIFSDALNHASLIDGARLSRAQTRVFAHKDVTALRQLLDVHRRTTPEAARFVVTESLFSMDGDTAPLGDYASLCRDYQAMLIVDEAHAVGIFGPQGTGLIELAGSESDRASWISINTAGKALGVGGAFVAGPAWVIDYLVQRARPFVFTTAAPPAVAEAIDASLTIVQEEPEARQRLLTLARYLRDRLAAAGIVCPAGASQIVPVILGSNDQAVRVADHIQRRGFDVRAIRPPSVPEGTARLRVSVNAALDPPTLDRFVDALAAAVQAEGVAITSRMRECSAASS